MANNLGIRPWILDTGGGGVLWKGWIKIKNIEFNPTADTDVAVIKNQNGDTIINFNGSADLSPSFTTEIGWIQGFDLSSISAGCTVKVYIV